MNDKPLVSCIMPTSNRGSFISLAIKYFLNQDYTNIELIILDDSDIPVRTLIPDNSKIRYYYTDPGYSIGYLRNCCCALAKGEIINHFDDDDWYAPDWISKQVEFLIGSGADITGLSEVNYFSIELNKFWHYEYTETPTDWVYGASLAYWKSYWEKKPFKPMNTGEDNKFLSESCKHIHAHNYTKGYLGIIHGGNLGVQFEEDPRKKVQVEKWVTEIEAPKIQTSVFAEVKLKEWPLVSCIMPTANREQFISLAITNFLNQDYPNKELVILDDGKRSIKNLVKEDPQISYYYFKQLGSLGTKRNKACDLAKGDLIAHFDDDDWYAKDWISRQVFNLLKSDADIVGLNQVQFFSPLLNKYWMIKNDNSKKPWLTGASLIYRKSFWKTHPFQDINIKEDDEFIRNSGGKVCGHDYYQGFIATLHSKNSTIKFFENPKYKKTN